MPARAFKTDKDFLNKFVAYVDYCKEEKRLPNVAGFTVFADINRDTFYQYKNIYPDTFKKVNEMLEDEAINNKTVNETFKIFYMKNKCGYRDRQEIDSNVSVNSFEKLTEEELRKIANE